MRRCRIALFLLPRVPVLLLLGCVFVSAGTLPLERVGAAGDDAPGWRKHPVYRGERVNTAVGGDFTGDGRVDVIANSGGKTRLFVAPQWKSIVLDETAGHNFIHSEVFDVDGDGDLDLLIAGQQSENVAWYENPLR